jgi:hypothetical protein
MKRLITTEKWTSRQAALRLSGGKWEISFLASSAGDIFTMGGQVASFRTPKYDEAGTIMANWITSGLIPADSETLAPQRFKTFE